MSDRTEEDGAKETSDERPAPSGAPVGRRVVLGLAAASAVGIAFGAKIDDAVGGFLTSASNDLGGLGALVPGADNFRIYTVTGTIPTIPTATYRLHVNGMVDHPLVLSVDDLRTMK